MDKKDSLSPENLQIVRSGYDKDGRWINVLRWQPSKKTKVTYLVTRSHSNLQRLSLQKKDYLAFTGENIFIDYTCPIGVPTYYSVFSCYDGKINTLGIWKYGGVRPGEIGNLNYRWKSPDLVQIYWTSPKNVYNTVIRRSEITPPSFGWATQSGIELNSENSAIDTAPPKNKEYYYTVWSIYQDPEPAQYRKKTFGAGVSIVVLPYGVNKIVKKYDVPLNENVNVQLVLSSVEMVEVGTKPFQQLGCPVCGKVIMGLLTECNLCKTLYHKECWDFIGRCGNYYCLCEDATCI